MGFYREDKMGTTNSKKDELMQEYYQAFHQSRRSNCDEIIKIHQALIGKKVEDKNGKVQDLGIRFITDLIIRNYTEDYHSNHTRIKEIEKFLNSKYFSDYFKQILRRTNNEQEDSSLINNVLSSERNLNEFTETEFVRIAAMLEKSDKIAIDLETLIFLTLQLDSEETKKFIKAFLGEEQLIHIITQTSKVTENMTSGAIFNIYKKLSKIYTTMALNMAVMTLCMPSLGKEEFISSLHSLSENNYELDNLVIVTKPRLQTSRNGYLGPMYEDTTATTIFDENHLNTELLKHDFRSLLTPEELDLIYFKINRIQKEKRRIRGF